MLLTLRKYGSLRKLNPAISERIWSPGPLTRRSTRKPNPAPARAQPRFAENLTQSRYWRLTRLSPQCLTRLSCREANP